MDRIATEMTVDLQLELEWLKHLEGMPILLTYEHLSSLFGRSSGALRHAVCKPKSPMDLLLREARVTVGRRAYFKRTSLAKLLAIAEASSAVGMAADGGDQR